MLVDGGIIIVLTYINLNHQHKSEYGIHISDSWKAVSFIEMKIRPKICKIYNH